MFAIVCVASFIGAVTAQFGLLIGTPADELLIGGNSVDLLFGGQGNDIIFGRGGTDLLFGGEGIDVLFGGTGDDLLVGQQGIDFLFGQQGNDILVGSRGNDVLLGGSGNDAFVYDLEQNGTDIIIDFNPLEDLIVLFSFVENPVIPNFSCDTAGNIYYENDELAQILTKPQFIVIMTVFIDVAALQANASLIDNPILLATIDLASIATVSFGAGLCLNRPPRVLNIFCVII